jgi:hypothetical protein
MLNVNLNNLYSEIGSPLGDANHLEFRGENGDAFS